MSTTATGCWTVTNAGHQTEEERGRGRVRMSVGRATVIDRVHHLVVNGSQTKSEQTASEFQLVQSCAQCR